MPKPCCFLGLDHSIGSRSDKILFITVVVQKLRLSAGNVEIASVGEFPVRNAPDTALFVSNQSAANTHGCGTLQMVQPFDSVSAARMTLAGRP